MKTQRVVAVILEKCGESKTFLNTDHKDERYKELPYVQDYIAVMFDRLMLGLT